MKLFVQRLRRCFLEAGSGLKNALPFEWAGEIAMRGPHDEKPTTRAPGNASQSEAVIGDPRRFAAPEVAEDWRALCRTPVRTKWLLAYNVRMTRSWLGLILMMSLDAVGASAQSGITNLAMTLVGTGGGIGKPGIIDAHFDRGLFTVSYSVTDPVNKFTTMYANSPPLSFTGIDGGMTDSNIVLLFAGNGNDGVRFKDINPHVRNNGRDGTASVAWGAGLLTVQLVPSPTTSRARHFASLERERQLPAYLGNYLLDRLNRGTLHLTAEFGNS